ncbi:3'-5' exonuclease [Vampirovibrio chlorellavorus]|uniref:3'-5' exonuclease n=1 Tax=Vampirovibrio chlorellavorus TaxID=758823 RepID=UPI0026F15276|nr:3'-5' exonuclease [Vampirovibrio chlorellavorus]
MTEAMLEAVKPDDTIIILDTETTGLDHKCEKLIEIAAVKMQGTEIVETFSSLVNPQKPIRHSSFLIHNISEEMVQDAPNIEEVLPRFLEFVGDHAFVAHNAIFDYSFINEAMKATYGKRFVNHRIDTFEMYRSVFPDEQSHGLNALLRRFGYNEDVVHRALDDAMCLAKVYPRLRALYEQKFSWQLSQLKNVPYLMERYIRMQKASQSLQAEMSDLKDIFKMYFQNGGAPVEASTGEVMVFNYRRSYSYNEKQIWEIATEAGVCERIFKLNPRALDKLVERSDIDERFKEAFREARLSMHEARNINFLKPQIVTESPEDSEES